MNKISTAGPVNPRAPQEMYDLESRKERVESLRKKAATPKEIEKAASGFESLLVHQMLKGMWQTVDTTGLLGEESNQSEIFRDMFHQAIADSVSEGRGIGIKQFVKGELNRAEGASKKK